MGKWSKAVYLLCASMLMTSCSGLGEAVRTAEQTFVTEGDVELDAVTEAVPEGEASVTAEETQAVSGGMQEDIAGDDAEAASYAYSTLQSREERLLYQEILRSLQNREQETELSTLDQDLLEPVFRCVMADHPEIFYVDGYTSTSYRLGSALKKITFSGDYTMEDREIERRSVLLEAELERWLSDMPAESDYEKVKYLYEYLISHTEYELGCADSQNICSVLLNGRSVCQGYAKAFQLLCQRAGIPAFLVTGKVRGQGHAWNLISVDGQWYYVDPTWGDASYRQEDEYPPSAYPAVNYDYFCVTTQQIAMTHSPDESIELPECTAVEAQYYRHEGLYLESADPERVRAIFDRAAQSGAETVTFQCADDGVYEEVYRLLIEEQKVFDYLPTADSKVAYADSPGQRTLSFWLTE